MSCLNVKVMQSDEEGFRVSGAGCRNASLVALTVGLSETCSSAAPGTRHRNDFCPTKTQLVAQFTCVA